MNDLKLKKVIAYTVYSSDDERRSSEKGVYKDRNIAATKAVGSGWYGSDGEVREKKDVYDDGNGNLYHAVPIGQFTDVSEKYREETLASIKSKLTKEELVLLGI